MATSVHANFKLRIAEVKTGQRGRATNKNVTWEQLCERLGPSRLQIDQQHTIEQFLALPLDEQNRLKDLGSFVGGPFRDGIRKNANLEARYVLTLDIDTTTPGQIADLKDGMVGLTDYEFVAYSTRRHTPEKPKYRIVLPLTRPVSRDEFAALSRIVGSTYADTVSASMDAIDNVSFTYAQIMYLPAICRGSEFDYFRNFGQLVDPDKVLEAWGPWQDWTQLPHSDKRKAVRPSSAKKAEDPTTKKGIVGNFCRAYTVPQAIEKFLPKIYTIGEAAGGKQRYTYAPGTSTNGAIVEDDGLFLFSHHGSDPCGERLVNAFDLVRINLYGDQDREVNENEETPTRMPSYKAFVEFLKDDAPTRKQAAEARYDVVAMFEDVDDEDDDGLGDDVDSTDIIDDGLGDEIEDDGLSDELGPVKKTKKKKAAVEEDDTDWIANELDLETNGEIKVTLTNLAIILHRDPRFKGMPASNKMSRSVVARKSLRSRMGIVPTIKLVDKMDGDPWSKDYDTSIRAILEAPAGKGKSGYGLRVTDRDLDAAVNLAAAHNKFHPVVDYLEKQVWDGKERVETLFIDYFGTPDTPYHRETAMLFCVAAVARAIEPGHKFDFAPIVEGLQGKRKTTFISTLALGRWYIGLSGDMADRKLMVEQMLKSWIVELPELAGLYKSEVQDTKAFISATEDTVRLSYERRADVYKRGQVFFGSTNDAEYLKDPTGNRRFWPIKCYVDTIDTDKLAVEIHQIWAEATDRYKKWRKRQPKGDLPLYLSDEANTEAKEAQDDARIETNSDALSSMIEQWLDEPVNPSGRPSIDDTFDEMDGVEQRYQRVMVCGVQIWKEYFSRDIAHYDNKAQQMVSTAMRRLEGWSQGQRETIDGYGRQRTFVRKGVLLDPLTKNPTVRLIDPDDDFDV